MVKITDVIGVSVDDTPGGLAKVLNALKSNGIELDYIYAFVGRTGKNASVVMKCGDAEKALKSLSDEGIKIITSESIYND